MFQTFSASVIGAGVTYSLLAETGAVGTINTTVGLVSQGLFSGLIGIAITVIVLKLLKNPELNEAIAAFGRYLKDTPPVALEPTDVSS
jgi:FtsH-binding integral membrane protein